MPAVEAGAQLYAAGHSDAMRRGFDPRTAGNRPVSFSGLGAFARAAVQQIAHGLDFTLLLIQGRLYHAGSNECGLRGNGSRDYDPHPDFAEIPLPVLAVEVVCGAYFALVLLQNGTLLSWGENSSKQLGRGGDAHRPHPVAGLGKVRHVYAGWRFAFVLLAGGEVRAWGSNSSGELCLGRTGAAEGSPQRVTDLCGKAAAIALSCRAGIALLTDDSAVAWGDLRGKLADGTGGWDAERGCMPLCLGLGAVHAVGAGGHFLCAHLEDDRLVSWGGSSSVACLGRDGPAHVPTPVPFPGDEPITDFFCLAFCLFAKGPNGWAACGDGRLGLPFGESGEVRRLTLIPRPWVPCLQQGGTRCFYVRAASESACLTPRRPGDKRKREDGDDAATLGPPAAAAAAATGTAAPRTLAEAAGSAPAEGSARADVPRRSAEIGAALGSVLTGMDFGKPRSSVSSRSSSDGPAPAPAAAAAAAPAAAAAGSTGAQPPAPAAGVATASVPAAQCAECAALRRRLAERDAEVLTQHDKLGAAARRTENAEAKVRRLKGELAAAEKQRTAQAEAATALRDKVAELDAELAERERAAAEAAAALRKELDQVRADSASRQRDLERQVAELRERLDAAAPRAPAEAVARFFSRYSVTSPATREEQVGNWVKDILLGCSKLPGAGPPAEFEGMYEELRNAVDAKPPATDVHPVAARAVRFWTAGDLPQGGMHGGPSMNATYKGRGIEFCTWVGHAVCFGNEALLERVVPYLRTLNLFCVARRDGVDRAPVWDKLRANSWRLYRGSGFDAAHRDWYRPGLLHRQLRAVATSLKRDTALEFAKRRCENGEWPVLWEIEIDSKYPHCHHVNHLGPGVSLYPTEDEFLFPNASVFTVVRVEWQTERRSDRPSLIVLRAACDNRDYALDLPVAPRS